MNHDLSLIGAPSDAGASRPGARLGPQALRAAGLTAALRRLGFDVLDRGDLNGPPWPELAPLEGYRHLGEVAAWNSAVHDAVFTEIASGRLPIVMGGDHSLSIGSISAVARACRRIGKTLRVLWLDAHGDCNSRETSPSGNLHGMPVACLRGLGPAALTRLSGRIPAIDPATLRQIGVRSVDKGEAQLQQTLGLRVYTMRSIAELGMREVMTRALCGMDANTHLHVSFDVDFLDPAVAPGVGTAVRGGPCLHDALLCMATIADSGQLASLDVMELNPALDAHHTTAELTAHLLTSLLGRGAPTPCPPP